MKTPLPGLNTLRGIRVFLFAICILGVMPRSSADITLNARLSDAQAYAEANFLTDSPAAQTQSDFQPASLTNSAHAHPAEGGSADASSTSNSSIVTNNPPGSLRVTGDGTASAIAVGIGTATAHASAKLIELTFTLSGGAYSYSLTGQLSSSDCSFCLVDAFNRATLKSGSTTLFTVSTPPNVTLSQTGTLGAGTYTLSVELKVEASASCCTAPNGSDNFNFALDPVATPTPPGMSDISGNVSDCWNVTPGPVPNVTLTLTGSVSASTTTDSSGNYHLVAPSGGNYTVTPSKTPLTPGSAGITTVDVVAVQRHYLNIAFIAPGCHLIAADVNGDSAITTVDVIAIQRFFLGLSFGLANVGQYHFSPVNRVYSGIIGNQTDQNYDTLVLGDVAAPFVSP